MIDFDWKKDYTGEFVCPYCDENGLRLWGSTRKKNKLCCPNCRRDIVVSHDIKLLKPDREINWRRDYKVGEFACPNPECGARQMWLNGTDNKSGKQNFRCGNCGFFTVTAIDLSPQNLSRIAHHPHSVKQFYFDDNMWDLRALVPSFDAQDDKPYANFDNVQQDWFRFLVKRYIHHQCKAGDSAATVARDLCHLRIFSRYLSEQNIIGIHEINRVVIQDFKTWDKPTEIAIRNRLNSLRRFFCIGAIHAWFNVDQDIIQDKDFPKRKVSNPDPISDTVRQQIENNLHKLPDPIARMWLIAFFTAMRPNELALLRKDCLIQEGSDWKIVWWRKKVKDQHEVPITRTIAKVIQEQQEYIQQLWGDNWEYLFCHYQGFSSTNPFQPKLQPVKKVIPKVHNSLTVAIRCLIKVEDIRDDNGNLARFSSCLVRPTRLTQLFEHGHDLAVVSAWAGHKQLKTTALHYTYVSCDLIEKEAGHVQKALFNADGQYVRYDSLPKSFWSSPRAHQLDLPADHINTPIYGYCGLPLDQDCKKFRACYTCRCFVAVPEKLSLYIKTRDELRAKESKAKANGQDVLVEQYGRQADQLDKIIASLKEAA